MDSQTSMVITVMDADRPGIVADVTEAISALGGNLADLSQTVLRGYFTMILVAGFPAGTSAGEVEGSLRKNGGFHIHVARGNRLLPETENSAHVYVLSAVAHNRIGLVAQVSRFCCKHGVNILDLTSHAEDDLYTMMLQIDLSSIEHVERFERELAAFGRESGLNLVLQHYDIFRATNEI